MVGWSYVRLVFVSSAFLVFISSMMVMSLASFSWDLFMLSSIQEILLSRSSIVF